MSPLLLPGRRALVTSREVAAAAAATVALRVKVGSYTGNGNVNGQAITGVGFQPTVVLVKGNTAQSPVIATDTMGVGSAKVLLGNVALATDQIKSLDSDGFTVGGHARVNANGVTYHYLALAPNGTGALKTLSYTGDGNDNRNITGVGFQPDLVITLPANVEYVFFRTADHVGDASSIFDLNTYANGIQGFHSDGFQVGSGTEVNQSGIVFHAICVKAQAGVFRTAAYTGDGTDNRSVGGFGFQPDFAVTKHATGNDAVARYRDQVGDASLALSTTEAANGLQAFESDGFQVGTAAGVNANGVTFRAFAFKNT